MILYLWRHGIAEDAREGQGDDGRALTKEGQAKMRANARGFLKLVKAKEIGVVLTSPLLRARQTAEIVLEAIEKAGGKAELKTSAVLGEEGKAAGLVKAVREAAGKGAVIAVGHEPMIGAWVGELCFGVSGRVAVKKGAVAGIELAEKGVAGELVMLMQGGMLRGV